MKAVEVLMEHGVPEGRIIFINLISCPEGLKAFCGKYPSVRVVRKLCLLALPCLWNISVRSLGGSIKASMRKPILSLALATLARGG